jgi:hypothetical protein
MIMCMLAPVEFLVDFKLLCCNCCTVRCVLSSPLHADSTKKVYNRFFGELLLKLNEVLLAGALPSIWSHLGDLYSLTLNSNALNGVLAEPGVLPTGPFSLTAAADMRTATTPHEHEMNPFIDSVPCNAYC